MEIRKSKETEKDNILKIHKLAFGKQKGDEIAKLVEDLFDDKTARPILSLVAEEHGKLKGHILFTRAVIENSSEPISIQLLAPLAVLPSEQGKGIGAKLISKGLKILQQEGVHLVFVLGHPEYYPRSGFKPAGEKGFMAPYPIPEEHAGAWMVTELNGNFIGKIKGTLKCSEVLNEEQHWRE